MKLVKHKSSKSKTVNTATVIVTFKPTVLDPQGMTIQRVIAGNGFSEVADVRQGKYFEIRLRDGILKADAERIMQRLAKEVLANPVIEHYQVLCS